MVECVGGKAPERLSLAHLAHDEHLAPDGIQSLAPWLVFLLVGPQPHAADLPHEPLVSLAGTGQWRDAVEFLALEYESDSVPPPLPVRVSACLNSYLAGWMVSCVRVRVVQRH